MNELIFLMGKFPAVLPTDLRYARNHMWARALGPGQWQFGFTSYAIRLMQDVYFLDWQVSAGDQIAHLQEVGHIETSKAESDLFAPLAGVLREFNPALLQDPSAINVAGYGAGWLFSMETQDDSPLMDVQAYHEFLTAGWERTQQMIKGKINTTEDPE